MHAAAKPSTSCQGVQNLKEIIQPKAVLLASCTQSPEPGRGAECLTASHKRTRIEVCWHRSMIPLVENMLVQYSAGGAVGWVSRPQNKAVTQEDVVIITSHGLVCLTYRAGVTAE